VKNTRRGIDSLGCRVVACVLAAGMLAAAGGTVAAASTDAATATAPVNAAFVQAAVPPSLTAVESSAEDIVDFALARDRREVVAEAARLRTTANGSAATALARAGVPSRKIAQLKERANRVARVSRGGTFVGIALAANAVSELMPGFYGRFHNRVPAAVLTLDYLDREAQLRSLARQPRKVALAVDRLEPTWTRLRPKVVAAGGAKEAAAFGRHVAAMKRLADGPPKQLQAEAERGLALVDELEQVFLR